MSVLNPSLGIEGPEGKAIISNEYSKTAGIVKKPDEQSAKVDPSERASGDLAV